MTAQRQSPTDLLADAEQRWLRIADRRPELAAAVELQRVLVTRGAEVAADAERLTRGASAAPEDVAERLAREDAPVLDLAINDLDIERLTTALLAARGGSPHIHMTERTLSSCRGEVIDDEVGMKSAQERLRTSHRSRNSRNTARKRAAGRP